MARQGELSIDAMDALHQGLDQSGPLQPLGQTGQLLQPDESRQPAVQRATGGVAVRQLDELLLPLGWILAQQGELGLQRIHQLLLVAPLQPTVDGVAGVTPELLEGPQHPLLGSAGLLDPSQRQQGLGRPGRADDAGQGQRPALGILGRLQQFLVAAP